MYYQLEYDKCLLAQNTIFYEEKNELIDGVSMFLRFSEVFEENNFKKDNFEKYVEINGETKGLCSLVKASFNNQSKEFSFEQNEEYKGFFQVVGFTKDIVPTKELDIAKELDKLTGIKAAYCVSELIDTEEFYFIIEKYGNLFENDDWLQNCSYGWNEVRLFNDYTELIDKNSYFTYDPYKKKVVIAEYQESKTETVWEVNDNEGCEWLEIDYLLPVSKRTLNKLKKNGRINLCK